MLASRSGISTFSARWSVTRKYSKGRRPDLFQSLARRDRIFEIREHLVDRIAGDVDALALDAFIDRFLFAAFGVWKEDRARMIDDRRLTSREPIVVTAIARLHVKNGNPAASGDDRGEGAVCVTEDEHLIRFVLGKRLRRPC
jgi:hypothetical protein